MAAASAGVMKVNQDTDKHANDHISMNIPPLSPPPKKKKIV